MDTRKKKPRNKFIAHPYNMTDNIILLHRYSYKTVGTASVKKIYDKNNERDGNGERNIILVYYVCTVCNVIRIEQNVRFAVSRFRYRDAAAVVIV